MKFLFCTLVSLWLVIIPSIPEILTRGRNPKSPMKTQTINNHPKVLVMWGYSYSPCPNIWGCDVYVDSFRIIPYKNGQYQKTHLISDHHDSIRPFYILVGSSAGIYSGTRITTVGKFIMGPYDDKVYSWEFTANEDGAFERVNGQSISIKDEIKSKVTISMTFTYNKFQALK